MILVQTRPPCRKQLTVTPVFSPDFFFFFAVEEIFAGCRHRRKSPSGLWSDGVGGALRLLADVALKTLVSYWMLSVETDRERGQNIRRK